MKKLLLILVCTSSILAGSTLSEQDNKFYRNEIRESVQNAKRLAMQHNKGTDPYQNVWKHQDYLDELRLRINSINKAAKDFQWYDMPIYSVRDDGERFFISQAANPNGRRIMRPRRQVRKG